MESLALVIVVAQISAVIALFVGVLTCLAQARIAATAIESIARQPESAGKVQSSMIIGLAMAETAGIYGLLISFLLIFVNPLVQIYLNYAVRP